MATSRVAFAKDIYPDLRISNEEFRILFIRPSDDRDAPLKGQLEIASFGEQEVDQYKTLSYAWDDQHGYRSIKLNTGDFRISATVDKALRHIRALNVRRVWVDQICI